MSARSKRVLKEIEDGSKTTAFEFLDDIDGKFGDKGNCYLRFWQKDGPYAGQIHVLQIKFAYGSNTKYAFPKSPPSLTFITPIYHANVYRAGAICLDIIRDEKWSPMYHIDAIFASMELLLVEPNPSSPANGEAGSDFRKLSPAEFKQRAMDYYIKGLMVSREPGAEKPNMVTLVKTDAFKSGITDFTLRDGYGQTILAILGDKK